MRKVRGFTILEATVAMLVLSAVAVTALSAMQLQTTRNLSRHSVSQAALLHRALDAYYFEECGFSSPQQPSLDVIESDYLGRSFQWPAYVTSIDLAIPIWNAANSHGVVTFTYSEPAMAQRVSRLSGNATITSGNSVEFRKLFTSSISASATKTQLHREIFNNSRC